MNLARCLACLSCAAMMGCTGLLPRTQTVDVSPFESYEGARAAFEKMVPYRTRQGALASFGLDTRSAANVEQVPYPQWVGRLVQANVPLAQVDAGIRDCLAAGQSCRAYVFKFGHVERRRLGDFLTDFFNFRRVTRTQGWRFEGVVLLRDDLVLFHSHGGQPTIELWDDRHNPLGPFQAMGESVPSGALP